MFRSYLLIAFRNIKRHKFYSVINILGLAIGIAGFLLAAMWVTDELSYDKHFANADRIYRIETSLITNGKPKQMAATDPRIAEHLRKDYPQIENAVRLLTVPTLFSAGSKNVYEENTFYADSTFFQVFSFSFVSGDPQTALDKPHSVVIAESMATEIFGAANPIGQTILINNTRTKAEKLACRVTGVIRDNKFQSHFHPRAVISKFRRMETFEQTYILVKEGDGPKVFTDKIWPEIYRDYFIEDYKKDNQDVRLDRLQPLSQIHLNGNKWEDLETNGNIALVYILSAIGFLILLIASVNYINLATAQSFTRAREVGMRKVLGATKKQLLTQFLLESIILCFLSLLLALSFVEMVLPSFNSLADKQLTFDIGRPQTIVFLVTFAIIVGGLSGLYPAFFISSFQPVNALKGATDISRTKPALRKAIVILQFSISIIMLIATMVIARQLDFVKHQDLGFDTDRVLLVDLDDQQVNANKNAFRQALLKNKNISKVSITYNVPGSEINHTFISFEMPGGLEPQLINSMFVDYDYINLMGLHLLEGQNFDSTMVPRTDTEAFVILNESAVKLLGWSHPVGKKIETGRYYGLRKGYCIGVVKDFHVSSLHDEITPLVLALGTLGRPEERSNFVSMKIKRHHMEQTIKYVERTYKSFGQGYPFKYTFLDEQFNRQYRKEEKQKILFNWFAGLSIFISCLGLIGLASFFTRQRGKEICIRKISGASVQSIVLLLLTDFIKLVMIALVIATPVAYYAMHHWLDTFAYHITLGWEFFAIAGLFSIVIVVATIGIQTIIAAKKDPATILKYE